MSGKRVEIWRHECIRCRHIWWSFERYAPCPKCGNKLCNFHDKFEMTEDEAKQKLMDSKEVGS